MFQKAYTLTENQWQRVNDYIQTNLCQQIEVRELANLVHLHPVYFNYMFRCSTGFPPHRYITKLRLDKAAQLLVDTDLEIGEVGLQVGYLDYSWFGNIFKKYFEVSPQTWRRNQRNLALKNCATI